MDFTSDRLPRRCAGRRSRRFLLGFALVLAALPLYSQEAIFVVRHVEKQSDSNAPPTPLSEAGRARARRLAEILRDAGVTAIYSTDMVRTKETVEPLARLRHLPVRIYAAANAQGNADPGVLVSMLKKARPTDIVLVVGHGDTIGPLLTALGCRGDVRIGSADYDNLFVVVPRPGRDPQLLRLRY